MSITKVKFMLEGENGREARGGYSGALCAESPTWAYALCPSLWVSFIIQEEKVKSNKKWEREKKGGGKGGRWGEGGREGREVRGRKVGGGRKRLGSHGPWGKDRCLSS